MLKELVVPLLEMGVIVKKCLLWWEAFCFDPTEIERQVKIWLEKSLKVWGNSWYSPGRWSTLDMQMCPLMSRWHEFTHSADSVLQELGKQYIVPPFKVFTMGKRQGNHPSIAVWQGLWERWMWAGPGEAERQASEPKLDIFLKEMVCELSLKG